jgi:hypothetical protein
LSAPTGLGRPYFIARAGSAAVAGMAQIERRRPDEPIAQWISYLSVSNVDSAVARLTTAGGRVLVAPTDIQASRAAIVVDPQGAPFGLVRLGPESEPATGRAVGAGRQLPVARLLREGCRARAHVLLQPRGARGNRHSSGPTRSCSTS